MKLPSISNDIKRLRSDNFLTFDTCIARLKGPLDPPKTPLLESRSLSAASDVLDQ